MVNEISAGCAGLSIGSSSTHVKALMHAMTQTMTLIIEYLQS